MAFFDLLGTGNPSLVAPTALCFGLVSIHAKALRVDAHLLFKLHSHVLIRVLELNELGDLRCQHLLGVRTFCTYRLLVESQGQGRRNLGAVITTVE